MKNIEKISVTFLLVLLSIVTLNAQVTEATKPQIGIKVVLTFQIYTPKIMMTSINLILV